MDHSFPGSSVHGIFQARILEWGATAFSADTLWGYLNTVIPEYLHGMGSRTPVDIKIHRFKFLIYNGGEFAYKATTSRPILRQIKICRGIIQEQTVEKDQVYSPLLRSQSSLTAISIGTPARLR